MQRPTHDGSDWSYRMVIEDREFCATQDTHTSALGLLAWLSLQTMCPNLPCMPHPPTSAASAAAAHPLCRLQAHGRDAAHHPHLRHRPAGLHLHPHAVALHPLHHRRCASSSLPVMRHAALCHVASCCLYYILYIYCSRPPPPACRAAPHRLHRVHFLRRRRPLPAARLGLWLRQGQPREAGPHHALLAGLHAAHRRGGCCPAGPADTPTRLGVWRTGVPLLSYVLSMAAAARPRSAQADDRMSPSHAYTRLRPLTPFDPLLASADRAGVLHVPCGREDDGAHRRQAVPANARTALLGARRPARRHRRAGRPGGRRRGGGGRAVVELPAQRPGVMSARLRPFALWRVSRLSPRTAAGCSHPQRCHHSTALWFCARHPPPTPPPPTHPPFPPVV